MLIILEEFGIDTKITQKKSPGVMEMWCMFIQRVIYWVCIYIGHYQAFT